jgi:hypothetical protein
LEPPLCVVFSQVKKEFILYLFEIPLVDLLTLTIILISLFNPYINITSQNFSSTPFNLLFIILYSSPPCGSTLVLPGYLLIRHSYTWEKTSTLWSCQVFDVVAEEINYCINYNIYFIFSFHFSFYLTFVSFVLFCFFFYYFFLPFILFLHVHESLVTYIKW